MTTSQHSALLNQLAAQIHLCDRCRLAQTRQCAVPGEGPQAAPFLLIGEGPGFHEDQHGRPFVGASGKLLAKLLASIGLHRADVFIANVVKCRPPENRDPQPDEISACAPYLDQQIAAIQPRVIITLGRFSMARYFPGQAITRVHGQHKEINGRIHVPMFHPAAALRNPQWMTALQEDFARLRPLVDKLYPQRMVALPSAQPAPEQLSWL